MTKPFYIVLFFMFSFFLIPNKSFACEKLCCKSKTEKQATKECCKKNNHHKKNGGCEGKCKNPTCQNPTSNFNLILPSFVELKFNNFDFSNQKQNFSFQETNITDGFYSIWTPPNIG